MSVWPEHVDIDYLRAMWDAHKPRDAEEWRKLYLCEWPMENETKNRFKVEYGGRQSGKTAARILDEAVDRLAAEAVFGWDVGLGDHSVGVMASVGPDGRFTIKEILAEDFYRKPEPPKPPKPAKPVDFFPNYIGRIDKLPRYPGVWG